MDSGIESFEGTHLKVLKELNSNSLYIASRLPKLDEKNTESNDTKRSGEINWINEIYNTCTLPKEKVCCKDLEDKGRFDRKNLVAQFESENPYKRNVVLEPDIFDVNGMKFSTYRQKSPPLRSCHIENVDPTNSDSLQRIPEEIISRKSGIIQEDEQDNKNISLKHSENIPDVTMISPNDGREINWINKICNISNLAKEKVCCKDLENKRQFDRQNLVVQFESENPYKQHIILEPDLFDANGMKISTDLCKLFPVSSCHIENIDPTNSHSLPKIPEEIISRKSGIIQEDRQDNKNISPKHSENISDVMMTSPNDGKNNQNSKQVRGLKRKSSAKYEIHKRIKRKSGDLQHGNKIENEAVVTEIKQRILPRVMKSKMQVYKYSKFQRKRKMRRTKGK